MVALKKIIFCFAFFTSIFSYSQENYKLYEDYLPSSKCGEVIHYKYYSVSYCDENKLSEWAIHSPSVTMTGTEARFGTFKSDDEGRGASQDNWRNNPYDKGHLVPAANMRINKTAMREVYFMTNVSPQHKMFNRGGWKKLEQELRVKTVEWTEDKGNLTIISGHFGKIGEMGEDKIPIPEYYYKIAFDITKNRAIAFLLPNKIIDKNLESYSVSISYLEKLTGIDFFYKMDSSTQFQLEKLATSDLAQNNNTGVLSENKAEIDIKNWFYDNIKEEVISNKREALVIGNTNYKNDRINLKNPVNDAILMKKSLIELGFTVKLMLDLDKLELFKELKDFQLRQKDSDFSLIYYAGHAFQDENGNSYLIPTDFINDNNFENDAVAINPFLKYYDNSNKPTLFILDACRDINNEGLSRPLIKDPLNIKLSYSTSFGKTASENKNRMNTIYTSALSKFLLLDGLTVQQIFHNTSKWVKESTNENQVPANYFGLNVDDLQFSKTNNKVD